MKKILLYSIVAVAILTSGCKKILEQLPTDAQPGDDVLKTSANVLAVLSATYNVFIGGSFLSGEVKRTAELYGDQVDFVNVNSGAPAQFVSHQFSIFNQNGRDLWFNGYDGIGRANVVIRAIDENTFSDTTTAVKNIWKGEALFIRAVAHFELVRLFAKPYTNNPTVDPGIVIRQKALTATEAQVQRQRATVKESYDAIIADFKMAESLLPDANGIRATKWAAKAYLARVYFSMADYTNAFTYANDVITNGGFSLGTNVQAPFGTTGNIAAPPTGVIFMALADAGLLRGNFWNTDLNNTYLPLNSTFYSTITARGGTRATVLTTMAPNGRPISLKWSGSNAINVPVIRLSEMYLIRAESRIQNGGFTDADVRADYNAVSAVAGVPPDNLTVGAPALLNEIRKERAVEFFTEGDAYHEARRLKLDIRGIAFNDATGLLKIPDGEMRANPSMIQN